MRSFPLFLIAAVGAVPLTARAQTSASPPFVVNVLTAGDQVLPSAARDHRGYMVVVWTSGTGDGDGTSVRGRRFDGRGQPSGGEFQVNTFTTGSQATAGKRSVAVAPDGRFVVVWQSPHDGDGGGVFARRFASNGAAVGEEFLVNQDTTGEQGHAAVAIAADGRFVIVWQDATADGDGSGIRGQRFDALGAPIGLPFVVNAVATGSQTAPSVAAGPTGDFLVAWEHPVGIDIKARYYDAQGAAGPEFMVNTFQANEQILPAVSADETGRFGVAYQSRLPNGLSIQWHVAWNTYFQGVPDSFERAIQPSVDPDIRHEAVRYYANIGSDNLYRIDPVTTLARSAWPVPGVTHRALAIDRWGNVNAVWQGVDGDGAGIEARQFGALRPATLRLDAVAGASSDGNGVFEPSETVVVVPSWRNSAGLTLSFGGTLRDFTGPEGPAYDITLATASHGTVPDGAVSNCGSQCYALQVSAARRPSRHWDATVDEELTPSVDLGQHNRWRLHLGDSFADVPRSTPFYGFVETILHHGVTGGCGLDLYCPLLPTNRDQMAVFVQAAGEGTGYTPPPCGAAPFADVPTTSAFCPWIAELARRGVVAGCGGGNFCPGAAVARQEMAVFALGTLDPAFTPPPCTAAPFTDVPSSSPFCPHIAELARRGAVAGCGGGNFCPAAPVTRQEMAPIIGATFGLSLYGP